MPTLQDCGRCGPLWELISIKHVEGSTYALQFDAERVTIMTWDVMQGCTTFKSGTINPTQNVEEFDLDGVPDGTYSFKAECPTCKGYAFPLEFEVTHNGAESSTPTTPEAPVLTAEGINEDTIRLGWTQEGKVTDFLLQYLNGDEWTNVDGGVFGGTVRSWDTGPWPTDEEISFRMKARKTGADDSEWSNVAKATATEDAVTVTPSIIEDFVFLTNTTGYFDTDDFNDKITGLAPSSRVIRWCIRWDEYEKSPGVFGTDRIAARVAQIDAIYAAHGLNPPHYSVDFWGVRHDDKIEQFIPANDVVTFQNGKRATGDVVINKCYGLGSFSSKAYRAKMGACGYSITSCLKQVAPGRFFYNSFSTGQTEEFYNYLWDNPDSPSNFESHGDFCPTARDAFRIYCIHRFGANTPWGEASASATIPTAAWDEFHEPWVVSGMIQSGKGKVWAEFLNEEMDATVMAFAQGCKSADDSVAVIHFIADFFRLQANGWLVNSPSTFTLVSKLDGLYHSDGDMGSDGDYSKKYSSLDCSIPTWGADKLYFCELDYNDMYMLNPDGSPSTTVLPNKDAIKRVARAFYRKGGKGIHYAMSMTLAQAQKANEANLEILEEIRNGTLTRLDRSSAPNFTFDLSPMIFGGNNELLNTYNSTFGGTETNVVNVKLIKNY